MSDDRRDRLRGVLSILTRTVAALAVWLAFAAPAYAQRSYSVDEIAVDSMVRADGMLEVRESFTYDFRGEYTFGYREIPRSSRTAIEDIRVSENGREYRPGDTQQPGTFVVAERGSATRITWYFRANRERRSFALSYRIDGQVKRYPDTAELYYKFVGDQWDRPVGRVSATVRFPDTVAESDLRVWAHGPLHGTVRRADGRADFNVSPLPPKTFWEGRILFPTALVPELALESDQPHVNAVTIRRISTES